jgi:hypothetical protein
VNIKKYIDTQRDENTQGSKFTDAFPDAYKRKKGDTDSASKWTREMMIALQIYLVPMEDHTKVVPVAFYPTEEDVVKRYGKLIFDSSVDANYIKNDEMIAKLPDKSLRVLFSKAQILMKKREESALEDPDKLKGEDKPEKYSDALLRSLFEFLGVDDCAITDLVMKEEEYLLTNMGNVTFTSKTEFQIVKRKDIYHSPVYAWGEDKKLYLPTLSSFPNTVAQKAAESLAVAKKNFITRKPQEVFGIGVRHRFFTFWHAVFPAEYLDRLGGSLRREDIVWLKVFPVSEFGYDFCVPAERMKIIRMIVAIIDYLMHGAPLAGKY